MWPAINGDKFVGLVMVTGAFKLIAVAYSNLLKEVLAPWLDPIHPLLLKTLVLMRNNAISHSVRSPKHYQAITAYKVTG